MVLCEFSRRTLLGNPVNSSALKKNASWFLIPKRVGTLSVQDLGEQNEEVGTLLTTLIEIEEGLLSGLVAKAAFRELLDELYDDLE